MFTKKVSFSWQYTVLWFRKYVYTNLCHCRGFLTNYGFCNNPKFRNEQQFSQTACLFLSNIMILCKLSNFLVECFYCLCGIWRNELKNSFIHKKCIKFCQIFSSTVHDLSQLSLSLNCNAPRTWLDI